MYGRLVWRRKPLHSRVNLLRTPHHLRVDLSVDLSPKPICLVDSLTPICGPFTFSRGVRDTQTNDPTNPSGALPKEQLHLHLFYFLKSLDLA